MEENELRQDHPMNELIRSMVIVVYLLLQMAGRTFSQDFYEDYYLSVNFQYSNDFEINEPNNTHLECYKCGAYQHRDGDAFEAMLKDCRDNTDTTAVIETCPNSYVGIQTFRYCGITVQTVSGHITSFSRGCHFLRPCRELQLCEGKNHTGVCQYCCSSSLCNHGNVLSLSVPLLLIVAVLTWIDCYLS